MTSNRDAAYLLLPSMLLGMLIQDMLLGNIALEQVFDNQTSLSYS